MIRNYIINLKIKRLKNFGIKNKEEIIEVGTNGKMNEFQAAMGLEVLKEVEEEREKRKKNKEIKFILKLEK